MKLLNEVAFNRLCGTLIPLQRHIPSLIGQTYLCACGHLHELDFPNGVIGENGQGRFLLICPNDRSKVTLVEAIVEWVPHLKRLDTLAGHESN